MSANEKPLRFLYQTAPGRLLLKPLVSRPLSAAAGRFLDTPLSKPLIAPFVRSAGIDLADYLPEDYHCFNDCFTRRIRPELRPIPEDLSALISPCDGKLSVWKISDDTVLPIKQSRYTITSLLGSQKLAAPFRDGLCLVFRLCVDDYHRYCYFDSGVKSANIFLPGKLHTVRPIALETTPVFSENCREYTFLKTDHFGLAAQIEVGAMLVGKIENHHGPGPFVRGAEKGRFLYGGSTIVLLLRRNAARLLPELMERSAQGEEFRVRMGQIIGYAV
ncbi:MAG: phosphatidylserine decarboxylase [Oscillospiraceae bacterium]|nr:phosphatidylserine decarboxylase [Oscillospiraceae bacterium]